jgi:hypothetical protein
VKLARKLADELLLRDGQLPALQRALEADTRSEPRQAPTVAAVRSAPATDTSKQNRRRSRQAIHMNIRPLDADDVGYALTAWQEAHKTSPGCRRAPWWAYRREYGEMFKRIVDDGLTQMLGAYDERDRLLGFLVMSIGKRVHTLHWCQVKRKITRDGAERVLDRRRIFFALLEAADLGTRFVYTLRGPRVTNIENVRSLDELLVNDLRAQGVTATYVALKEWLK